MTYPSVLEPVCSSWGKQRKRRACDESLMMPASWCLANEYSQCRPCWPFIFSMQPHIQCQWFSICDLKFIVILYTLTKIPPPEYTNWILEWDQKPRPWDPRDKLTKYPQKIQPGGPPKENCCYWNWGEKSTGVYGHEPILQTTLQTYVYLWRKKSFCKRNGKGSVKSNKAQNLN